MDPPRRRDVNKSSTYKSWMKLYICDITASLVSLSPSFDSESTYSFNGHPIRWISIVGTVTSIDEHEKKILFSIDDGSGQCINAVARKDSMTSKDMPRLHSTVKARGELELYHDAWQLKLTSLELDAPLEAQIKFWTEANENHARLAKADARKRSKHTV
ncbi:hypothetical protein TWF102_000383 [Orbilia oligospora]|uniref:CST complex subunit Stn1 N-terminal domain-containing protein n=1 Tax=Orbilia oligospora TaxID=2813651 RepID=A0A7C8JB55_ORBOL|nr:hypothetical protein TWF102_000383 [Orbilia oligospora]KAF3113842.1 hypothetical protein TWF706_009210 [Orbilia oligospora]KAF3138261.1 hypothetical protein TWF703_004790 [Orbilia oligospora]